jgi:hypothetical protein
MISAQRASAENLYPIRVGDYLVIYQVLHHPHNHHEKIPGETTIRSGRHLSTTPPVFPGIYAVGPAPATSRAGDLPGAWFNAPLPSMLDMR